MNIRLRAHLHANPQQAERLKRLQEEFAQVCNAIAPQAQRTHCWNRVALHHMVYRDMRERYPALGSQMVCNAIYAVSRTCRAVYQSPGSPFHIHRIGPDALPLIQFAPDAPVYFDRHTISLKEGQASMYTLDGRIRFEVLLPPDDLRRLTTSRLREIVLTGRGNLYTLSFMLDGPSGSAAATTERHHRASADDDSDGPLQLPPYVRIVSPAARTAEQPRELR